MTWIGGEGGIRTHDTVSRIHAFQACALSHSATSPQWKNSTGNIATEFRVTKSDRTRNISAALSILKRAGNSSVPMYGRWRCGTIPRRFRYSARLRRGEAGGRHGSWAIVMAPRHSDPDHYFDMGAWRPARLILPSGSSVVVRSEGPAPSRAFSLRASAAMRVILHW
jgi:hypothetical protein